MPLASQLREAKEPLSKLRVFKPVSDVLERIILAIEVDATRVLREIEDLIEDFEQAIREQPEKWIN